MEPYKHYQFSWFDIATDNDWHNKKHLEDDLKDLIKEPIIHVAYFICELDGFYFFTQGHDSEKVFDITAIPKHCIVEFKEI